MQRLCRHLTQLRYVTWKVSMAWPLIRSICPQVKTLNLTPITPCLLRGNMCHGKNRRSLKIRQYYFSSCCWVSINCNLYQNEEGGRDISLSERHATAAADAVQAILLGQKVGLFIGPQACSCHNICWQKIYRHTLIHLWLLLIICPNDLSIKRRPSR